MDECIPEMDNLAEPFTQLATYFPSMLMMFESFSAEGRNHHFSGFDQMISHVPGKLACLQEIKDGRILPRAVGAESSRVSLMHLPPVRYTSVN
jgi:hypothetical protein